MTKILDRLIAAGVARGDAARVETPPVLAGDLDRDWGAARVHLAAGAELLARLPRKASRSEAEQRAAAELLAQGRAVREAFGRRHAPTVYDRLTRDRAAPLRMQELVAAAAAAFPGLVPGAAQLARERELPQMHKDGLEIDQGIFLAHVLADPLRGAHLLHAMAQPRPDARARLEAFRASDRLDLPPMSLERHGALGRITFHHLAWLNAEDDEYQDALETLVDVLLLDDRIAVGVLRGAPMTKAKYAGRRVFGAGINLTRLYHGQISLVRFMLERETGPLAKIHRGLARPEFEPGEHEDRLEKPFIAAVDAFAIGGHCQMLLVMDCVIAQRGAYFNLPARKEGIIPGLANLRLPRFVGERATRQGIFFNRDFAADGPAGHLLCDRVVDGDEEMERAVAEAAAEIVSAGTTSLVANRRALRTGAEPLDDLRRYMAVYAREQAHCLYSDALVDNLTRNWNAHQRRA